MHSILILRITAALSFATAAAINEFPGNLDLCIPKDSNENLFLDVSDNQLCLGAVNGLVQPLLRPSNETTFLWHYDNGLLRTPDGLCLGPNADTLSTGNDCKPYEMVMRDCPLDSIDEPDPVSRHMRFLITSEGRVQSLARVVDPTMDDDQASTRPYCLTMAKEENDEIEKAYLFPCEKSDKPSSKTKENKKEFVKEHHLFNVYGTYSGTFLMPLKRHWSTKETVELAFQVGLPVSSNQILSDASVNFIEITTLYPAAGNDLEIRVIDMLPLNSSNGIVSVQPLGSNLDGFGYQLNGKMTATLRTAEDSDDGVVKTTFIVSNNISDSVKKSTRSYMLYIYMVGGFVACFLLSVLTEKIFAKRVRSTGDGANDGANDGKTVCMSIDDEEDYDDHDLALDDSVEAGFGVIHICLDKDTPDTSSSESDTDIDQSRTSTFIDIPLESDV